ncbi:hypothetical protein L7F22_046861 [Adiantum nelumboides]|nr:hypothetical protein [Adiantum nelumboides]
MSILRCAGNHSLAFSAPHPSNIWHAEKCRGPPVVQVFAKKQQGGSELVQQAQSKQSMNGVIFEPFAEVQTNITHISSAPRGDSLARHYYSVPCEAAVNELTNVEYNVSYVYHALSAYFDRDNVALPGFAKYFKEGSDKEKGDAQRLIDFQNIRGGRVKLQSIVAPEMEFDNSEKGDALHAMELALSLQKLTYEKLLYLSKIAEEEDDPQMHDFVDGTLLPEQVNLIKKVAEYVSQVRRVGKGHGVYHFDLMLQG